MNRHIMMAMGVAFVSLISTGAEAATGKWCFVWNVEYDHNNLGEDRLTNNSANAPARYTFVSVQQTNPWSDIVLPIFLDSNGCTPTMTISPNTTYHFHQYTRAQRSTRDLYVMKDNEDWYSTDTFYSHWSWTTGGSYLISPYVKTFGPPWLVAQTRIMPVIGEMLLWASTLDWANGIDVWVSTDPDGPTGCANNNWCASDEYDPSKYMICLAILSEHKFGIAHEFGHMISKSQDGPSDGTTEGTEGIFRDPVDGHPSTGDHHCDSSYLNGDSHALTTREFTGMAQDEGFSQFVASATLNERDAVGAFVYGKGMMKWSTSHRETLDWPILLPPAYPPNWEHPQAVALSSGNGAGENVQWISDECDPSGGDFVHYGTEWDWMEFYWNLWVDGSNPFSISEINNVFSGTTDIAYECCLTHDANPVIPDACVPRALPQACNVSPNPPGFPTPLVVGKLWEDDADFDVTQGLLDTVRSTYGSLDPQYLLFEDLGTKTRVNY